MWCDTVVVDGDNGGGVVGLVVEEWVDGGGMGACSNGLMVGYGSGVVGWWWRSGWMVVEWVGVVMD